MEKMWDDDDIYDSGDEEQASEGMIYYSDEDDEIESEDKNKKVRLKT